MIKKKLSKAVIVSLIAPMTLAACLKSFQTEPNVKPQTTIVETPIRDRSPEDWQCLSDFFSCVDSQEKKGIYPAVCPVPKCVTDFVSDAEASLK